MGSGGLVEWAVGVWWRYYDFLFLKTLELLERMWRLLKVRSLWVILLLAQPPPRFTRYIHVHVQGVTDKLFLSE